MIHAIVDKDRCIGCGLCVELCPKVFYLDNDEYKAHIKVDPVPAEDEGDCRQAADLCPESAIKIEKTET